MLKITMLGLALAAFALVVAMPAANAETITVDEITCSDNHVPMTTPSGMSVCVFEESVQKLETRGFEFTGEPFDIFPIKSSDAEDSTLWTGDLPPVISISRLPEIGETAVVEINFTNSAWGHVTDTERYRNGFFETGWRVSSEFEIVDSGGLQYESIQPSGANEIIAYQYTAFTPLNAGESKTYRIEVRAVEEGRSYVSAYGYETTSGSIGMYIDDEETMLTRDHMALHPEMYERTARATSDEEPEPEPPTKEEARELEQNVREPTHEELVEFITAYVRDEQHSIEWALDNLLLPSGPLNMTEVRQVLADVGYTDDEIEAEWSSRASTQSSSQVKIT